MNWFRWLGRCARFAVQTVPAIGQAVFHPNWWLLPLHRILVGALPLGVVTGLALGIVIWLHTRDVLARTIAGATDLLPSFLSAAVLVELAPLAAGLILAARTGAALGAELAAMKVGEQVDALALLGVSPMKRLIGPRVLSCIIAGPVLHVLIAATAILGGFLAEVATGDTTMLKYQSAVLRELILSDVIPAALKTIVFGFVVGVIGCYTGLNASEGSEGVGQAATDSVVLCSLCVLMADVMLVTAIKAIQRIV